MKSVLKCILLMWTLSLPQQAMAIFEAHGLVGKRWYEIDDQGIQAVDVNVAAYLTLPIPLLTLGIGPSFHHFIPNEDDFQWETFDSATLTILGVEALVGVPLVGSGIEIFAKLRYNVWSQYKTSGTAWNAAGTATEDVEVEAKIAGTNIGVGLRYKLVPLVGLLLQVDMGQEKLTDIEMKSAGATFTADEDADFKSKAVLLGVNIGI